MPLLLMVMSPVKVQDGVILMLPTEFKWQHLCHAGMMGTIPNDVRGGLLELFYGVYEKDPDRCLPRMSLDTLVAPY